MNYIEEIYWESFKKLLDKDPSEVKIINLIK